VNHADFLHDLAGVRPPPRLNAWLVSLAGAGCTVVEPGAADNVHPLVVPAAREPDGSLIGLLCWPTAPESLPLPVVRQRPGDLGWTLELVAESVDQALHRELALRDAMGEDEPVALLEAVHRDGPLYSWGAVRQAGMNLAVYRLTQIGESHHFFEELVERHLDRGAGLAAMVTADRAARVAPGWARPMAFRALLLARLGEMDQARDSAAAALADPVWTLGHPFESVARLAGWGAISSDPFRRLADDTSKPIADRAAHLMDAVAVEGGHWDDARDDLARLYRDAGLVRTASLIEAPRS
jgi:hypothetical protein